MVGQNRDCHACPIAQFYSETSGHEVVISSDCGELSIDDGDGDEPLPYWAARFVSEIDDIEQPATVTAESALSVLADIR